MTPEQIKQLGPAFADYLRQFLFCCDVCVHGLNLCIHPDVCRIYG